MQRLLHHVYHKSCCLSSQGTPAKTLHKSADEGAEAGESADVLQVPGAARPITVMGAPGR